MKKLSLGWLLVLLMACGTASAGGPFNLYSPAAGIQKNTGSTFQNTAAAASDVAATYTGLSGCTGAAALLFNSTCGLLGTGTVTSVTCGTGLTGGTFSSTGTCALSTPVSATNGGTGEAGTITGVLKGNGTSAFSAALAADTAATYTGSSGCSGAAAMLFNATCSLFVTGVTVTVPAPMTATGCVITSSGTCAITWTGSQTANQVLASPNGSTGPVGLRALVAADIPALGYVTSITLTAPAPLTPTGCTISSSGTCALTWTTGQTANEFLASPNGSTGPVGLRAIVAADVPTLNQSTTGNAATASASDHSPTQCASGQYSTGSTTTWAANCAQVAYSQLSGTPSVPTTSSGSFTGTLSGMTAGITDTCVYSVIGNSVVLFIGAATGTSNASTFTITGLPSAVQPTRTQWLAVPYDAVENNSNITPSNPNIISADVSGSTITFNVGGNNTAFANTNGKGVFSGFSVAYLLN